MLGKRIINAGGVSCTTDTTQILDAGTTDSVALYRFEDNANDTASSTGKFNKGGVFNGSSSKIDLPDNILPDNSTGSSSASVWFKSSSGNTAGDSETILDAYAYDTNKPGWGLFMEPAYGGNPDGHLYLANYSLGGTSGGTSISYRDGNWHHAVVVLDNPNNTIKLYIDGNSTPVLSQTASAANVWPFTEKAAIGYQNASASNPRYFNGNIDQVRVFNKALSTSEITTLYNETTTTANTLQVLSDTSCVAAYTFEGNANDLDTTTPKNGTASNVIYDYSGTTSNVTYATGKFNKSAVFNTNGLITVSSALPWTNSFSISMWLKPSSGLSASNYYIPFYQKGYDSGIGGVGLAFYIYGYTLRPWVGTIGGSYYNIFNTGTLTANQWNHVVLTRNYGVAWELFLNGSSLGTYTAQGLTNDFSDTEYYFGGYFGGSYGYIGEIDQARIFSKALSPGEINNLYNETTTTAALGNISNPSTIAYYKMQSGTDETGSYNATTINNVNFNVEGKYGFAGKFNGTNSYMTTGLTWPGGTQLSWSGWIKTVNTKNTYIFGDFDAAGANSSHRFSIRIYSQILQASVNDAGGGLGTTITFGTFAHYGEWAHLVITVDGTAVKGYVNGSQLGSTGTSSQSLAAGVNAFVLGNYGATTGAAQQFDGTIDQVRIFNKAISASEVTTLYNEIQCANTITTPESYFNTKLYTGTGSAQSITGVGFEPGLVWTKNIGATASHYLFDSVRGVGKEIYSDLNAVEYTDSTTVTSFDSNGFSLGTGTGVNNSGHNFVAWNWKAASSNTTNNDGTIASTVRASQESGFSIVTYSPNNTVGMSIGHGLSKAPSLVITKRLDTTQDWGVYTNVSTGDTTTNWLSLNDSDAYGSGSYMTLKSTTLELPATGAFWASASSNQVAYCFANIDGYQRIGSYVGTAGTGPFVYTGFEPAWLMIKEVSNTGNWCIYDNKRDTVNPNSKVLAANSNNAESSYSSGYNVNFYTNGFEIAEDASNDLNTSGSTYMFMAIAANPDTTAPTKANSFKTKIYTGNGGTQSITGVGFKPDLTWVKNRSTTGNHSLIDSVRGVNKPINPNANNLEQDYPGFTLTSFLNDGFSVTDNSDGLYGWNGPAGSTYGGSTGGYVSWNWKALDHDKNLATINNDGSIPSIVSANPAAGFSIVRYTNINTVQQFAVGHGLSSAPQIIFQKKYGPSSTSTSDWYVITNVIDGSIDYLNLNGTAAKTDMTGSFANFQIGSSTFTDWWTGTDLDIINYCFHSVTGYSSIGKYTGNGSTTGPSITVGFRPSWVLIKRTSDTGGWYIFDATRAGSTTAFPKILYANLNNAEYDTTGTAYDGMVITTTATTFEVDFSSAWTNLNASGSTYLYMAFK